MDFPPKRQATSPRAHHQTSMSPLLPKTAQTDVPKTDKEGEKMYTATEVQELGEMYAAQVQRRMWIACVMFILACFGYQYLEERRTSPVRMRTDRT